MTSVEDKESDQWMAQQDIRSDLANGSPADDGLVLLHFTRESCLESTTALTKCLSHRNAKHALIRGFGGMRNRFNPVVFRNSAPQISPHFKRYRELRLGFHQTMINRDGQTVARWRVTEEDGTRRSELYIQREFFAEEIQLRKLTPLWCYDSIRWSERTLAELGMSRDRCGKELVDSEYAYWFACDNEDKGASHPRMKSWTRLCGQRFFYLTDHRTLSRE